MLIRRDTLPRVDVGDDLLIAAIGDAPAETTGFEASDGEREFSLHDAHTADEAWETLSEDRAAAFELAWGGL